MNSLNRILAVVTKEVRQLSRDKITFAMIVMIPLMQLILFGYAINTDVRQVPVGLVNYSDSTNARYLTYDLQASQAVEFKNQFSSVREAESAITRGEVNAILVIPEDFERRLSDHRMGITSRPLGQWLTDASDPMLSNTIHGLRQVPLSDNGLLQGGEPNAILEVVHYFNPTRRTAINIVPGLVAIILTMTMVLFTSAAIVREREQGNMEFLINTPVKPVELMLGKILPYMFIGFIQTSIILGLGHALFAVPVPTDIFSLFIVTLLFILASLTLGLLISIRAKTQLEAMQMTVFLLMPSILLSGFMFPFVAMPEPAQWLAEILPATHYMRMIRAVVLRGAHWTDLILDVAALSGFIFVGVTIATLKFKKRLD